MSTGLVWDLLVRDSASPSFLKVAAAADKAAASTAKSQKGVQNWTAGAAKTGAALTKALTLPIVGAAAVSVVQAARYQKSLNTIAVATDQTKASMAQASKGLLTISEQTATSTGQLTDSLYTAAKSGKSMSQSLAIVKAAAEGAKAEGADLGTVTNALTSIMASYGSKLANPVQAMNALVRGAGLSKTTTQEFAGSLSTVVPIAAKAGVSFDQIGGAIATLTQHGTSANEATQELAFALRNLQAPNNVAVSAMNQLGISAVDISKNLGKRGLTGTLDYIGSKLPQSALVYVGAMKKMEAGTSDLALMQSKMTPALRQASKEFVNGTLSAADYRKEYRSLGATGNAQGASFLSLSQKVKGYSDAVKGGTPAQKTAVSLLKQMMGGAEGLNTYLQLTGESSKTFTNDTNAVGKAMKSNSKDVVGFAQTTQTLTFKWDQAKTKLAAAGISLGTTLLPAVSKLADMGSRAAGWVDGLNGSQRKVLIWSVGTLAALGPVLSIGSKLSLVGKGIGSFVSSASVQLATLRGATETEALATAGAMTKLTAALGGAAIGLAVGTLTQDSSTATKALGALGSAAAGAAIGFGVAGGPGALIGGLAGGVTALAKSFLHMGGRASSASKEASKGLSQQKQDAADLYTQLQAVNGAYNDQYKLSVEQKLQKSGVLDKASAADLNTHQILNAALGKSQAKSSLQAQMDVLFKKISTPTTGRVSISMGPNGLPIIGTGSVGTAATQKDIKQYQALLSVMKELGLAVPNAADAEKKFEIQQTALGKTVVPTTALTKGVANLSKELSGFGTSLATNSAYGLRNAEVIKENLAQVGKQADAQLKAGASVAQVTSWYNAQTAALSSNLQALGFNRRQVQQIEAQYGKMPSRVVTRLERKGVTAGEIQALISKYGRIPATILTAVNKKGVTAGEIQALISKYDQIPVAKNTTITTTYQTVGALPDGPSFRQPTKKADGGIIRGPGSGTSDTAGVFALSNGEAVIPAKGVQKYPGLVHALISAGRGLASGGIVHSGKDWIYNGTKYASQRAAENAKTSYDKSHAQTLQSGLLSKVNTSLGNVGSAATPTFDINDVGVNRVNAQIKSSVAALNTAVKDGLQAKYIPALSARIQALAKLAQAQLKGLTVHVTQTDIPALRTALKGTVDDTRSSLATLYSDLSKEGATAGSMAYIKTYGSALVKAQSNYQNANNKLSTMKDYSSGIASTLTGAFDPTRYGSVTDLLTGFSGATSTNKAYAGELGKLRGEAKGNPGLLAFINQLAQSGQTATLQTLAAASPAQLAQVTKAVGSYNSSVANGANQATITDFGKSVAAQTAAVKSAADNMNQFASDVADLAAAIGQHALSQDAHTEAQIVAALRKLNAKKKAGTKR